MHRHASRGTAQPARAAAWPLGRARASAREKETWVVQRAVLPANRHPGESRDPHAVHVGPGFRRGDELYLAWMRFAAASSASFGDWRPSITLPSADTIADQ